MHWRWCTEHTSEVHSPVSSVVCRSVTCIHVLILSFTHRASQHHAWGFTAASRLPVRLQSRAAVITGAFQAGYCSTTSSALLSLSLSLRGASGDFQHFCRTRSHTWLSKVGHCSTSAENKERLQRESISHVWFEFDLQFWHTAVSSNPPLNYQTQLAISTEKVTIIRRGYYVGLLQQSQLL